MTSGGAKVSAGEVISKYLRDEAKNQEGNETTCGFFTGGKFLLTELMAEDASFSTKKIYPDLRVRE